MLKEMRIKEGQRIFRLKIEVRQKIGESGKRDCRLVVVFIVALSNIHSSKG